MMPLKQCLDFLMEGIALHVVLGFAGLIVAGMLFGLCEWIYHRIIAWHGKQTVTSQVDIPDEIKRAA